MKEIYEKLKIAEFMYPHAESLNPILHDVILQKNSDPLKPPAIHAKMTGWKTNDELFDIIKDFANYNLKLNFDADDVMCSECWGVLYSDGDFIEYHNHEPSVYSFVYFVNVPENSSQLIFDTSGHVVKPEEGKMVIFDSKLNHHVPKNYCDGRSVVSGNFVYTGDSGVYGLT